MTNNRTRYYTVCSMAAFGLCTAVLALLPAVQVDAHKGKPQANATVTVTFADRTDGSGVIVDGLSSDNGQPYTGEVIPASGDLRVDLTTGTREIVVRLGAPGTNPPAVGSVPSNQSFYTDAVLFVHDIQGVATGTTAKRLGRIGMGSAYPDHALGFRYTTSQGIVVYGTELCVTRRNVTGAIWDISSSCAQEPSDTAGFFEENLKGKINHKFKATYAVPFALTVTCTLSCPQ